MLLGCGGFMVNLVNLLKNEKINKRMLFLTLSTENNIETSLLIKAIEVILKDENIDRHVKGEIVYEFSKHFSNKNINMKKVSQLMAATKELHYMYLFAKNIKGVDLDCISLAVSKCGNSKEIYTFAKNIEGVNIEILSQGLAKLDKGLDMYDMAKEFEGADIKALSKGVSKTNNSALIYRFAKDIKDADIDVLARGLTKCTRPSDAKYIYTFIEEFGVSDHLGELTKTIIATGNARVIYGLALNIEGVDIIALEKAIIKTKNFDYIDLFRKNIKGSKIINSILKDSSLKINPESYYDNIQTRTRNIKR